VFNKSLALTFKSASLRMSWRKKPASKYKAPFNGPADVDAGHGWCRSGISVSPRTLRLS
jgi:hypothetical protein